VAAVGNKSQVADLHTAMRRRVTYLCDWEDARYGQDEDDVRVSLTLIALYDVVVRRA